MDPFKVAIVAIICYTIVTIYKYQNPQPKGKGKAAKSEDEVDTKALQLEVMALKKRVETLESIVTDKSYDLKREIDSL